MSWGRARTLALALTVAATVASSSPSPAAGRAYAISRGTTSAMTGTELLVPSLVLPQGTDLWFLNLHLWGHNITSDAWLTPSVRLFRSDITSFGEEKLVAGVSALVPGTYGFFCRNHISMRGSITIV